MNKNCALLLDRDGVVNVDHGYVGNVTRFDFMPGLFDFLRAAHDRGYRLAILTNQSGVARGLYTEDDYAQVTRYMLKMLVGEGIGIDLTLACFEHPEGMVSAYHRESFWRKPNAGMILEAVRRLRLDPAASVFIGDHARDMQAARQGGIGTCLWLTSQDKTAPEGVQIITGFKQALAYL